MNNNLELPLEIAEIFNKLEDKKFKVFAVGGSVRDMLLGKKAIDWDLTTDAKPEEIVELFKDSPVSSPFYDNKFGTVGIPIESGVVEVTTMRKEGDYHDHRHPVEVSWTDKIEEDLGRRDFTINALAMDRNGNITDPFGGLLDLQKGILKAVNNPDKRFQEDALRLLRAIRFSTQLNFEIEPDTFEAIKKNSHLISAIAHERVRDELFKLLGSDHAYEGVITLKDTGLLKEILPELTDCFGIVQQGPKHDRIYDIGEHSLLALKFTPSQDPLVKFAALLHDVGKSDTFATDEKGNVTFYNHEIAGARKVSQIAKRFNLSRKQTDKLYRLVRYHMFTVDEHQTDSAIRRFIKNVGLENLEDIFALRIGDRLGGGTPTKTSWRMEKFQDRIAEVMTKPFSITDLKVSGHDVMETLGIPAGRKIGKILQKLFEEVSEDSTKNEREYLLARVRDLN